MRAVRGNKAGFSLIELLTLLAVITIIALVAVPGVGEILRQNELTTTINGFGSAHRIARSEAVARGRPVSVCTRGTDDEGATTCAASADWHGGWAVFVNEDDDDPAVIDPGETVLHVAYPLGTGMTLEGSGGTVRHVTYRPTGDIGAGVTFVLCDDGELGRSRLLEIAINGRITIARRNASGVPIREDGTEISSCDP